ncbi:Hypothetical Protein FCC1311_083682 [Hondaea fermentalgiana]|uniref:Transcription factor Iwr1 domain-containing protein n=1 Tax=Hondaea fermentalgiana TaxID=2315210 RepID=A0A2R5GU18_9STRA|nr:Hypothetical Protein FCC1311_083682 [Hondaea fermentalgiana]|eukprot:GBG32143.1 Hypothetical Protein FCC1311_083682 [Hondaea fermentalgiana]
MLVKKPGADGVSDVPDVAVERRLLFEVLKERRVTVLERVARMERNLHAVNQLRRTHGVTEDHVGSYYNQAVAMSDLMTAATWGARPSDLSTATSAPAELAPAKIDPAWLDSVHANARQEAEAAGEPGSIAEAQALIRAKLALERGDEENETPSSDHGGGTAGSDKVCDEASKNEEDGGPQPPARTTRGKRGGRGLAKSNAKALDACEDLSELAAGRPSRTRRKPMLQSVATRLKKTIVRRPKHSEEHLDSLDATIVRTTETRKSADGARTVRVRKIKKRVKKVKPMKQEKERRRSVLGIRKSFVVSMADAFGGSQPSKSKDASFEIKMDELKALRRRGKLRAGTEKTSTRGRAESEPMAPGVETLAAGPPSSESDVPALGPRLLTPSTLPEMEPAVSGARVGMLTSQSKRYLANRSSLDFSRYALYFGEGTRAPGGAPAATGPRPAPMLAQPETEKKERSRPKSYDARGLSSQSRRFEVQYELEPTSGASASSGDASSSRQFPDDAEEILLDANASFRTGGGLSEYSEFTILEEEEFEEDDDNDEIGGFYGAYEDDEDDEDDDNDIINKNKDEAARELALAPGMGDGGATNEDFYVQLTF